MNKYSEELQNYKDNVNFNQKNILDIGANEGIMIDFLNSILLILKLLVLNHIHIIF